MHVFCDLKDDCDDGIDEATCRKLKPRVFAVVLLQPVWPIRPTDVDETNCPGESCRSCGLLCGVFEECGGYIVSSPGYGNKPKVDLY